MDRKQKIQLLEDLKSGKKALKDLPFANREYTRKDASKLTIEEFEMISVFLGKTRNSTLGIYPITDDMNWDEEYEKFRRYIDEAIRTRPLNYGGVVSVVN